MLKIQNLKVSVENPASTKVTAGKKEILKGISLTIRSGELHVMMGPNGSGKSTLAYAVAGHPRYKIAKGKVILANRDITKLSPDKRAKLGLFLAFQHPVEVPGVKMFQFLRTADKSLKNPKTNPPSPRLRRTMKNGEAKRSVTEFLENAKSELKTVGMAENFLERSLNDGFSGGEKKRSEIFQMQILKPKIAILDEPDSGLDIDGVKMIAEKIMDAKKEGVGILLISHNPKILDYLKPDFIHLIVDGKIVKSGKKEIVKEIEEKGFGPSELKGDIIYSA